MSGTGIGKVSGGPKKRKKSKKAQDDEPYRTVQQKPPNQEKLKSEELKEEFSRVLTTHNPLKSKNLVVWDFKDNRFVPHLDENTNYVTLFSMPSELYDTESQELDRENPIDTLELIDEISDNEEQEIVEAQKTVSGVSAKEQELKPQKLVPSKTNTEKEEEVEEPEDDKEEGTGGEPPKKLLNQFNYCERGAQTQLYRSREHGVQTEHPNRSSYRDTCNQWIIYDAYKADEINRPKETAKVRPDEHLIEDETHPPHEEHKKGEKQKEVSRKEEARVAEKPKIKVLKPPPSDSYQGSDLTLLKAVDGLRFMERLIGSNVFEDVIEDFKYYEDGADEFRDPSEIAYGSLLPLWKFIYEKAKKMHVTSISWSESQPDMFAVTFGSFNFVHPVRNGLVVIFTLRNTTYPEFVWNAPKGAMSCHVHPQRNCLVAVGLYDGNVAVLNLEKDRDNKTQTEVLQNVPTVLKHRAPVWSVKWGDDDADGNPSFYACGMCGKFIQWVVGLRDIQGFGGLDGNELAMLYLPTEPVKGPDGTCYKLFGCARVIAFHPKEKNNFLVGTAEGKIFKCSALYASRFLKIYQAHFLPVAALEWNHYHADIFISCSEDWTIKIWDQRETSPMYVFEIGIPILDVCWAPYSSTLFCAVTDEGKVLVYDININKERPICSQQVVTKKKVHPHRIQFNPLYPIIVVGDDRGCLITLKMSPNLRLMPKDSRNIFYLEGETRVQYEINKMKKLLSLVKDPQSVTNPTSIPKETKLISYETIGPTSIGISNIKTNGIK